MKVSYVGLIASLGCIILCGLFLFWNPYTETKVSYDTAFIICIMLVLPACIGLLSSFIKSRVLMYIALVWSLPYGLYFTFAKTPSIFNLFAVVLILYLGAALLMKVFRKGGRI